MKGKYSDGPIVTIRFDTKQVQDLNDLAEKLQLPRTTLARRLFSMVLNDVKQGRKIFES